ncbi:cAMP-regulated phosphoprotein 19 [Schistocerca nitens]|uniref:cAMP-regulated phosphoprotein 19 n=1 Tax=Schistocerca nitens TaxID=7011 RepID=UPI00211874B3|nr:cAMP-regulated phosphoprotein 19 [Schistocerca nitens]
MSEQEAAQTNDEVTQETERDTAADAVSVADIEKKEEEKLKAKFPMMGRPMSGQSVFLQKRLANRQKYFDSGDYQMAKQKSAAKARQVPAGIAYVTGDAIPTPETVPVRKTSIIQPCKFTSSSTT